MWFSTVEKWKNHSIPVVIMEKMWFSTVEMWKNRSIPVVSMEKYGFPQWKSGIPTVFHWKIDIPAEKSYLATPKLSNYINNYSYI